MILKLLQDGLSARHGHLGRIRLILSIRDLAIFLNYHGPAAISVAHASGPSVCLGEESLGITEEDLRNTKSAYVASAKG